MKMSLPRKILTETDLWALGISMLKHHAPEYVEENCFSIGFYEEFQRRLPEEGPLERFELVWIFLMDLKKHFRPLCQKSPTWKRLVPAEMWDLLELLLTESSVGRQ